MQAWGSRPVLGMRVLRRGLVDGQGEVFSPAYQKMTTSDRHVTVSASPSTNVLPPRSNRSTKRKLSIAPMQLPARRKMKRRTGAPGVWRTHALVLEGKRVCQSGTYWRG